MQSLAPLSKIPRNHLFTLRRTILLVSAVAALAQAHFSQALILPRSRYSCTHCGAGVA